MIGTKHIMRADTEREKELATRVDVAPETQGRVILQSHCRTGLYKGWQMIMHGLIEKDPYSEYWDKYRTDAFRHIQNAMDGYPSSSQYFDHIKNPVEPLIGMALSTYGGENPFGTNFKDIAKEIKTLKHQPPFGVFGAFNEWTLLDREEMRDIGYKFVNLHRANMKDWFISGQLSMAIGIKGWHAWDDEGSDWLFNKRKSLYGKLIINKVALQTFFYTVDKYMDTLPCDAYVCYESLQGAPQVFMEECNFSGNIPLLGEIDSETRQISHPNKKTYNIKEGEYGSEYVGYLAMSEDEFNGLWDETKPHNYHDKYGISGID